MFFHTYAISNYIMFNNKRTLLLANVNIIIMKSNFYFVTWFHCTEFDANIVFQQYVYTINSNY